MSEPLHALVQAARRNDSSAWDRLFRRYQLALFTYARGIIEDREAAFDIVQETFIRASNYLGRLREDEKFGSWLFGIAHQRCLLHLRRGRREDALFSEESAPGEGDDGGPDPREAILSQERAQALYALVDRLPLAQRSALLLHILEGFSLEEIAAISEVPVGTVKSRLFHAKRALRALIEEIKA